MNFKNNNNNNTNGHSVIKHLLHMVICCGLPAIILLSLPFISGYSPALSGILAVIAPFICPIMMGSMIFMMFRGKGSSCCKQEKVTNSELPNNENK